MATLHLYIIKWVLYHVFDLYYLNWQSVLFLQNFTQTFLALKVVQSFFSMKHETNSVLKFFLVNIFWENFSKVHMKTFLIRLINPKQIILSDIFKYQKITFVVYNNNNNNNKVVRRWVFTIQIPLSLVRVWVLCSWDDAS